MWAEFGRCGVKVDPKTKVKVDGVFKNFTGIKGWKLKKVLGFLAFTTGVSSVLFCRLQKR